MIIIKIQEFLRERMRYAKNADKEYLENKTPLQRLAFNTVCLLIAGIFLFILLRSKIEKIAVVITIPVLLIFETVGYFKEVRNDREFKDKKSEYTERISPPVDWQNKYLEYKMNVGFEEIKSKTMKQELSKKFRKRETMMCAVMWGFLASCCIAMLFSPYDFVQKLIFAAFGGLLVYLTYREISLFTGSPVRKFYKGDFDFQRIEKSFMNGKMLNCENSGMNFGTDYIVYYEKKKVNIIDLSMVENVTKKVVRVKNFENNLYTGNDYRYYAVFHVRIPYSGKLVYPEIELNEFQAEMVIDEFKKRNYRGMTANIDVAEKTDATVVTP